ncbi:MAG: patatin-like phospholipase family protein [Clostridiales bacterium]|nr:patatin-like phospholipase family protein [Clostridiales bacterium]
MEPKHCCGVFEGGGVKGIGLVGAVKGIEEEGYKFDNVAGTSAGAIVASLIAVGYTGDEIKEEMMKLDFQKLQENDALTRFGLVGKSLKFLLKHGIFKADYLENWLENLYSRKGRTRFRDIIREDAPHERYKYRFQAIASDLSESSMLVLPRDLRQFGIDPDGFRISKAVRMSMSIPIFYEPFVLTDTDGRKHVIVDGGLLSNYPLWLLDSKSSQSLCPTLGFCFCSSDSVTSVDPLSVDYKPVTSVVGFTKAMVRTALDARDKHYISVAKGDYQRTIAISPHIIINGKEKTVSTVQFDITTDERIALFQNGVKSAKKFCRAWSFDTWKKRHWR